MSRAMFGPSKILKLTSSRSGQPPRAAQAHCHDSISLGGLPGLLLRRSSPTLQKSSESAGYSHRSPGRCQPPCGRCWPWKQWVEYCLEWLVGFLFAIWGATGRVMTPNAEKATSPGSVVAPFLLRSLTCWGPWTDLDAPVVMETKIVIWRKGPVSLKTLHIFLCYENIIYLLL